MNSTRVVAVLALTVGLAWTPAPTRANGMGFVERRTATGGTGGQIGKAVPTEQRAALLRNGPAWSLVLEPRYDRPKAGSAWLVPFGHCPSVAAADPALLAELGFVTAPLFFSVCVQSCQCRETSGTWTCSPSMLGSSGAGGDDGVATADSEGVQPLKVDVWQSGRIGSLEFVVISADNPADIPAWLDREGYDNPPELASFVTSNAATHGCYFAAKLGVPESEHDVFPAVRFDLDPRDPPSYPLRLTRLGVANDQSLGLTLYVVNPADQNEDGTTTEVVPDNFSTEVPDCDTKTEDAYRSCVVKAIAKEPTKLAVTFRDALASRRAAFLQGHICHASDPYDYPYGDSSWCVSASKVFSGIPASWTPEVQGWLAGEARVTRYEGRLPPEALDRDLVFRVVSTYGDRKSCQNNWDCVRNAEWAWEGNTCAPSGSGNTCARGCSDDDGCPTGWSCIRDYPNVCVPPTSTVNPVGDLLQVAPHPVDAIFAAITGNCGLDCDEVCYGTVASHRSSSESSETNAQRTRRVPVLAVVAAPLLLLVGLRRRRPVR